MDALLFVTVVVAVVVGAKTLKSYLAYKAQLREFEINHSKSNQSDLAVEVAALKSRVEVLEKIVTDKSYTIEREIRAL
ncbi:hypothetical protein A1OO_05700 [Enterovibrio norvegicus FF-33]|uniref:hypothetical protein n=1 Tax=Enterovibrio TaxID=188143 RepID=UPI0002F415F0|nr:hypothetical protein [Enterovibrio norvegicus]OEE70267.1 hypothetical protein A1OO_05700 [Enterovibrio norvegicus FF-33]OEE77520.1 hypothetical protein A1OQ_05210 [Enterovibrio norvegicus FF-162]